MHSMWDVRTYLLYSSLATVALRVKCFCQQLFQSLARGVVIHTLVG